MSTALTALPFRLVTRLVRSLPLDGAAWLGRAAGALAWVLDRRHRRVAKENLRMVFPERDEGWITATARENFRRIGEAYACAVKLPGMDPARTDPRVEFVGLEALLPARGRNLVVAAGHFGCFDLLALAATRCGGRTLATTYRGQRIRGLEVVLQELRGLTGVRFFERRGGVAALAALLKGGDVVLGLFVDQHAGTRGAWLPFLGRECSCSTAPAVLALRHDADLAIAICHRTGPARWRVELGPAIPTHGPDATPREVEAMTLDVNRAFEVAIRRDPANWFWVHRRWKPRPEPGPSDPERAVSGPQREAGA